MKKTKIAILGLGTIGYGVYDIIQKRLSDKIEVKKIFDKDFSKQDLVNGIITDKFDDILEDNEIEIVVETLGGLNFPYSLITQAMEKKKNIVSANKEVVSKYIKELSALKEKMGIAFSFEAAVGGGVPIIKNLIDISNTNDVDKIVGIINGTTNFILTRLSQGMDFDSAMEEAIKAGFAERDSSYDLDGLDMARKIAILTDIATNKFVNVDDVYHYSMKNAKLEDLNFVKELGFNIKYLAAYENNFISVEPRLVKGMFAYTNDEYNLISVNASNYTNLKFYGKGAGRYPTANAIVNDIVDIINGNKNYTFKAIDDFKLEEDDNEYIFYLRVKDINKFNKDLGFIIMDNQVLTKNIKMKELDFENIEFYAKAL